MQREKTKIPQSLPCSLTKAEAAYKRARSFLCIPDGIFEALMQTLHCFQGLLRAIRAALLDHTAQHSKDEISKEIFAKIEARDSDACAYRLQSTAYIYIYIENFCR